LSCSFSCVFIVQSQPKNKLTSLFAAFNTSDVFNLLEIVEYQCTSAKFIRLPNRIESKLFCPNWNALICTSTCTHLCRAQDVSCCCSVVGLSVGVGHGRAPCKNGRTDRDAALNVDYGQPKEPCKFIGWGPDAQREGALWAFILWHAQTCPVSSVSIIRQGAAAMRPLATTTVAACFEIATPSLSCIQNHIVVYVKKVKFSHTRYRALVPELIPVYRQSARR